MLNQHSAFKPVRFSFILGTLPLLVAIAQPNAAQAIELTTIFVNNASFENSTLSGWEFSGGASVFEPTSNFFGSGIGAPDGSQVLQLTNGVLFQSLSDVLLPGATYTLQVDVGRQPNTSFPAYGIQLCAGGSLLGCAGDSLLAAASPTTNSTGGFLSPTLTFTAPELDFLPLGQPLGIRIFASTANRSAYFDNIRLAILDPNGGPVEPPIDVEIPNPPVEEPTPPAEPNPPVEEPTLPEDPNPPVEEPTLPEEPNPPVEEPTLPGEPNPPIEEPTLPEEPNPPVEEPTLPEEPNPPIEEPTLPEEPNPPIEEPTLPEEPNPPIEEPTLPGEPNPPIEEPTLPGEPNPPIEEPTLPEEPNPPIEEPTPSEPTSPVEQPGADPGSDPRPTPAPEPAPGVVLPPGSGVEESPVSVPEPTSILGFLALGVWGASSRFSRRRANQKGDR